jgi:predicted nicotinamide N-methyase
VQQSGHYLWPAAVHTAQYLIENLQRIPHQNVLELGAGCGLITIALGCTYGDPRIVATDHDPTVLDVLRANLAMNGDKLQSSVVVRELEWGEETSAEEEPAFFDLIYGSDLLYSKDVVSPLFQTIERLLRRPLPELDLDGTPSFVLGTSFDVGEDVESAIAVECSTRGLSRECVREGLGGSCKIDVYKRSA